MAQEIRLADGDNLAGLTLGGTDVQFVYLGSTLVWQNNQHPAIRVQDVMNFNDSGHNENITVVANQVNEIEFDVMDPDTDGHITKVTVEGPGVSLTELTLSPADQNQYDDLTFDIPSTAFTAVGPVSMNNVYTIKVTDNNDGEAEFTLTVTYASFEGPVIAVSGAGSGNSGTRQITGTATASASAPAGVIHYVAASATSISHAEAILQLNFLDADTPATLNPSAQNVNVACGGSAAVYFAAASYDATNEIFSGITTTSGTASHAGFPNISLGNTNRLFLGADIYAVAENVAIQRSCPSGNHSQRASESIIWEFTDGTNWTSSPAFGRSFSHGFTSGLGCTMTTTFSGNGTDTNVQTGSASSYFESVSPSIFISASPADSQNYTSTSVSISNYTGFDASKVAIFPDFAPPTNTGSPSNPLPATTTLTPATFTTGSQVSGTTWTVVANNAQSVTIGSVNQSTGAVTVTNTGAGQAGFSLRWRCTTKSDFSPGTDTVTSSSTSFRLAPAP